MYKVIVMQIDGLAEITLQDNQEFDKSLVVHDFRDGDAPQDVLEQLDIDHTNRLAARALKKEKENAIKLLKSTDWYVIRQLDSGKEMPEDVKQMRAEARLKL